MRKSRLIITMLVALTLLVSIVSGAMAEPVKEITYFHFMNTPYADAMLRNFELFEAENPGYKIVPEAISGDNYISILKSRIASGNSPDMYLWAGSGLGLSQWFDAAEDISNEPFWSAISEAGKAECTYEGTTVAFPFTSNVFGLLCNMDVFKAAGIEKMPLTLTELEATCAQLKAAGYTPFGLMIKDQWCALQLFRWLFGHNLGGFDKVVTRFGQYSSGEAKVTDDTWLKDEMKLMQIIKDNCQENPFSTDWNMGCQLLGEGKVAMIIQGDWSEVPARQFAPDVNLAIQLLPISEDPADAKIYVSASARSLFIGKGSPNKDGALAYMNWLATSPTAIKWYNEDLMCLAPIAGVAPSGDTVQILASSAQFISDPARVAPWGENLTSPDVFARFPTIQEEFFAGKIDQQGVIDTVTDEWYAYSQE